MRVVVGVVLTFLILIVGSVHAQGETVCEAGLRAFEHDLGTACVPETVERVIALEWTYAEDLLALGIQPIGVADIEGYNNWLDIPVELSADVADVGRRQEPNLERIAELAPDLILTASFRSVNNYEQLSAIAPTLAFNSYPEDGSTHYDAMLTAFTTIADAVNRQAEGQQVLANLEAHFAEAESALEAAGRASETFILSQGWIANDVATFRLFTDNAMSVQILEQIGLENAWDDVPQLYGFTEVTFEGFAGIDDTNFFYVAQGDANDVFAESALWNGLPFVQAGHDYWLGGDVWLFGGPLSAELLVDTILDAMDVALVSSQTFPITIEHKFGSTEITEAPQRVITLGYTEQDSLLAVGITPIAVRYWYGNESNAIFPWAQDEVGDAQPEVLNMSYGALNYEAILALDPDLISAIGSGITQEEYENLSQIAPTIAQSDEYVDFGSPWQVTTETIGQAVGRLSEAQAQIAGLEAKFEQVKAEHPEFEGKTIAVAYYWGGTFGFYNAQDARGRFFTELGFVIPDELNEVAGDSYYGTVSAERLDLLDQDLLVFVGLAFTEGGQESLESEPLLQGLSVMQDGRVIYIPAELDDALQFSTVLSLDYLLDGLVPELVEVVGE